VNFLVLFCASSGTEWLFCGARSDIPWLWTCASPSIPAKIFPFRDDVLMKGCAPGQGLRAESTQAAPAVPKALCKVTPGLLGELSPRGSCSKTI